VIHLSARLSWHDTGWNGRICAAPHLNASCIVQENIRDSRNDKKERSHAGQLLGDLAGWLPPCSRDTNTYSSESFSIWHRDPLERDFLKPVLEEIPPYATLPAPYRWLREEHFRDICEEEDLRIRGPENRNKAVGWVYEPDRQQALLERFWGKLSEGAGRALIFYYVNHGNPVDDNLRRLIVGVGRLREVGPQLYFEGRDQEGRQYPLWTRAVVQNYPEEGFRLPYQEYIQAGHDPRSIACEIPLSALLPFSFVGEHVSDDLAVSILERLLQCVGRVAEDGIVFGSWKKHLTWLNDCLDQVWRDRGPFPGIGSVLQYLGFDRGVAFHRLKLGELIQQGDNPWDYVRSILEAQTEPPPEYAAGFDRARNRWTALSRSPVRQALLESLIRFELTAEQVKRISDPDERKKAGIYASEEELLQNPYLICERDLGSRYSEPVDIETIDRGMYPEGEARLFQPVEEIPAQDDARRVRALAVSILKETAQAGDTLLALSDLLERIRDRFPERRRCRPDRDIFISDAPFHGEVLWLDFNITPALTGLKQIRQHEEVIRSVVEQRIRRINPDPDPPIDWAAALIGQFGEPDSEQKEAALQEQQAALQVLFKQRISVLTGGAGTGKTSLVRVLLDTLDALEGRRPALLLAPTGKARVRLSVLTQRNAFTIHQFLLKQGWYQPDIFALKESGGKQDVAASVIIDECSMIPVDLMGTLFKALELNMVRRLILVGDPNQLPPIGPGRPFVDIVAWLREHKPEAVATLETTMRVTAGDHVKAQEVSSALAFADGYRSDAAHPADDELLAAIAMGKQFADLEVHFWKDHDELDGILNDCMHSSLGIAGEKDYQGFNRSLGISDNPSKQGQWRQAERWQILSPLRINFFGTDQLNRRIQLAFKQGLIKRAKTPWTRSPRPFGDQEIVWTDKVIQVVNRRHQAWPKDAGGLDYIANGEIGIVVSTWKGQKGDSLDVGFSTQDGVTYRYYRGQVDENLELAYALTIHKAQGSDFEIVFLIVPQEAQTLSRELIYTGLTRFRKKLVLLIEKDTAALEKLRLPERSDTHRRNTFLFELSLRPDGEDYPYAEALIHRTRRGVAVRSKSEVIVAEILDDLGIAWKYEQKLAVPGNPQDFRLPDFTIGYQGDIYYWEHLGMLSVPSYRSAWNRKRQWYIEHLGIPVVGDGAVGEEDVKPGTSPVVITSRDNDDGGIDAARIEHLARKYILLE